MVIIAFFQKEYIMSNITIESTKFENLKTNKITYPVLVGIKNAKIKLEDLWCQANQNLQTLSVDTSLLQFLLNRIKHREC